MRTFWKSMLNEQERSFLRGELCPLGEAVRFVLMAAAHPARAIRPAPKGEKQ